VQASGKFVDWMTGRRRGVAITGASGWVGRAMVHMAVDALSPGRPVDLRLYGSQAGALAVGGRDWPVEPLAQARSLEGDAEWLVLHLAVAGAHQMADPTALRAANDAMLAQALALAATGQVRRLVYASSGAVYAHGGPPQKQAYSDLKREQEERVQAWSQATAVPLLIPRIFNLGGPYINHVQRYAIGSLVRQALDTGGVEIKAAHPVIRSYVHVLELAKVVFDLAVRDDGPLAFDTAGAEAIELTDLALAIGRALDLPNLDIRRPDLDDAPADRYVGDGATYQAALAQSRGRPAGLDRIIRDTAAYLRAGEAA